MIAPHEAGHDFAVGVQDAVGYAEAELVGVEILDGADIAGGERQMLDRPL